MTIHFAKNNAGLKNSKYVCHKFEKNVFMGQGFLAVLSHLPWKRQKKTYRKFGHMTLANNTHNSTTVKILPNLMIFGIKYEQQ